MILSQHCPSCDQMVSQNDSRCMICAYPLQGQKQHGVTIAPAVRPKIQVEVCTAVTVDRTGSSQQFAIGIPKTAGIIFEQVATKARSTRYWVQSHGDLDCNEQPILLTDGGTAEQAIHDINKIVYGGGGDAEEHHLDAIENLLKTVSWPVDKHRARGAMIAFLTADSKPARSRRKAQQIGEEIRAREILLYLVCEPTATLTKLVNAASGLMFTITNSPNPKELQKIAGQLAASIVASVSKGSTVPLSVA